MDIKYIEAGIWTECIRLSRYGSALDIDAVKIPSLERLHRTIKIGETTQDYQNFTTQLTSLIIRGPYDI